MKWDLQYQKGLRPHGPDWMHFAKGSYIHELMHYYYSLVIAGFEIGDPFLEKSITERIKSDLQEAVANLQEGEEIDFSFFDDCSRTVINYISNRSPIIDGTISQLQVERHLEHDWSGRSFHGYADLIYYDTHTKCWVIRDHKSGARSTFKLQNVFRNGQLLFYGTLLWVMEGIVADVEINFIHSNPPRNPKKTVIFDTIRVKHTETTYKNYWNYLMEVHERQSKTEPLRNLMACDNCAYFLICGSDLKGLSADNIIKGRYAQSSRKVYSENPIESVEAPKSFVINFGGGDN